MLVKDQARTQDFRSGGDEFLDQLKYEKHYQVKCVKMANTFSDTNRMCKALSKCKIKSK